MHTTSPPRKRARRGTSCLDCRKRKLKCDFLRPTCSRCLKSGSANRCTYETETGDRDDGSITASPSVRYAASDSRATTAYHLPTPASGPIYERHASTVAMSPNDTRIDRIEQRVEALAARFNTIPGEARTEAATPITPAVQTYGPVLNPFHPLVDAQQQEQGDSSEDQRPFVKKTRGFRTQQWGLSHPMSVTAVNELLISYNEGFLSRHPMLLRALKDLQLQDRCRKLRRKNTLTKPTLLPSDILPTREVIDPLVSIYLDTLENVYHVLHLPTFYAQYNQLWAQPVKSDTDQGFVVTVLLMAAAVTCVPEPRDINFVGEVSAKRETADQWVHCCEAWMASQSQKRVTLQHFQHRCLAMVARYINAIKMKAWYSDAGSLLRFAVSHGLHLDPERFYWHPFVSEFDREMRRRIWAAVVEIDYKAVYHRGVPSTIEALFPDCPPPTNVDDKELNLTMETAPDTSRSGTFRPVSAAIVRAGGRELQSRVLALVNRPNPSISRDDFFELEDEIMKILQGLPKWDMIAGGGAVVFTRASLELKWKQLLFLLYRLASKHDRQSNLQHLGRMGCLDTCASIVKQHASLSDEHSFLITALNGDIVQAAMNICFDLSMVSALDDPLDLRRRPDTVELLKIADKAISIFEHNIMRRGGVYRRYWVLLSARTVVEGKLYPARASEFDDAAAEKICNIIHRMLSLQAYPVDEKLLVDASQDSNVQGGSRSLFTTGTSEFQSGSLDLTNSDEAFLSSFDLTSLPDWNWEDLFR